MRLVALVCYIWSDGNFFCHGRQMTSSGTMEENYLQIFTVAKMHSEEKQRKQA